MPKRAIYSQDYIKKCFDAWYLAGRPSRPSDIKSIIPESILGTKPHVSQIRLWIVQGAWDAWADELDAKAYQIDDSALINAKAQMLREHLEQAKQVAAKALTHILKHDFDSSSSAVTAFFKGLEEQRKTQGFSDLLEKLDKMTNNDVEREIINLLNRASENDQIIDTVSQDVPELEDTNG